MKTHLIEEPMPYNGEALSPHWIYKNVGILGNAVVSFRGACDVNLARMVDLEDVLNADQIYSQDMQHFIIELFDASLKEGVLLQRLFSSILQHRLNDLLEGHVIERRGDDLFFQQTKKLSVSICTPSVTSVLMHVGLNIDSTNAPVEAAGLASDLGLSAEQIQQFPITVMRSLRDEWKDIRQACCKVRAV
ncbi:MAG: DUF366 family protein [Vampirovibrio sp.]